MSHSTKRALVIVFEGVEEVEALAPVDVLRRAGVETVVASTTSETTIKGRNEISFLADTPLDKVDPAQFDLIFLPGGPGVFELMEDERILELLRAHDQAGKITAAICAAPKALAKAGLLDERKATSHSSVRADLPNPSDDPIVDDDRVITSQGAGTAIDFGIYLVEKLVGLDNAREVAASIHASNPTGNN